MKVSQIELDILKTIWWTSIPYFPSNVMFPNGSLYSENVPGPKNPPSPQPSFIKENENVS